jgi:hypothetical protein
MNTIAITTASIVTPFTQNLKQPQPKRQTAKEAIASNVQALIEQLEQGHSDGLTAYLTAMGRFHNYSHLYHGNAALLTESLEVIQKTSAVILSALQSASESCLAAAS